MHRRSPHGCPLRAARMHAGVATIGLSAGRATVSAHGGAALSAGPTVVVRTVCAHQLATVVALAGVIRLSRMLHTAGAADQAVIAVLSAVRLIIRLRAGRIVVPPAIGTVVAVWVIRAVGTVVSVGAGTITGVGMIRAVGTVVPGVLRAGCTARMVDVWVPATIRAVIAVGAILAVRTVVRISAWMIVRVGVIRAVGRIIRVVLRSGRSVCPRPIAVVVCVVPDVVIDIGVVVVNDGGTAATAPVHVPGVPAPAAAEHS